MLLTGRSLRNFRFCWRKSKRVSANPKNNKSPKRSSTFPEHSKIEQRWISSGLIREIKQIRILSLGSSLDLNWKLKPRYKNALERILIWTAIESQHRIYNKILVRSSNSQEQKIWEVRPRTPKRLPDSLSRLEIQTLFTFVRI